MNSGIFVGGVFAGKLKRRVQNLEDTNVSTEYFAEISAGTSGTISPPSGGTFILDHWPGGVDAVVSTMDAGGLPDFQHARTASGDIVTATLDASGNYTLSGTPSVYPVALIYAYKVSLKDFDYTKSLGNVETEVVKGMPSGGTAGQIIRKKSGTDFDYELSDEIRYHDYGTITGGTLTIDAGSYDYVKAAIGADTTINFTGWSGAGEVTLELVNGGAYTTTFIGVQTETGDGFTLVSTGVDILKFYYNPDDSAIWGIHEASISLISGSITEPIYTTSNIDVLFSEVVDPTTVTTNGDGTGSFEVYDNTAGSWVAGSISTSDNLTFSFDPASDLTAGNSYTVYLSSSITGLATGRQYSDQDFSFTAQAAYPIASGLVASWLYNGDTLDSSGNGLNGTGYGLTLTSDQQGVANKAYSFGGGTDRVEVPYNSLFDFSNTDPFSICAWINSTYTTAGQCVVGKGFASSATEPGYLLYVLSTGEIRIYLTNNWSTNAIAVDTSGVNVLDGNWHFIAFTYDGSSSASGVTVYVDGVAVSTTVAYDTLSGSIAGTYTLLHGNRSGAGSDQFVGDISDVLIYSKELSASEVSTMYNGSK